MILRNELAAVCGAPDLWLSPLNDALGLYEIDTEQRTAYFLAQVAHESANFTQLEENLNYSPAGLLATFPTHFTPAESVDFAHDPERIANRAYANRMGNGDEASGDGYLFRGRGLIQLTGRTAYRRCTGGLGVNVEAAPEKLTEPLYASLSAAWYWRSNGCNELADAGLFSSITRRINGGLTGEPQREALLRTITTALA
jgi:putative chitinase